MMRNKGTLPLLLLGFLLSSPLLAQKEGEPNISFERSDFKEHFNDSLGKTERWRSWRHAYRNVTDWVEAGKQLIRNSPHMWKKALAKFEKAFEVNANSASVHFGMGKCYLQSNRKFKALEYFKTAHSLNPEVHPRIQFFLGRAYHLNGKWDKAEKAYREYHRQIRRRKEQKGLKIEKELVKKRLEEAQAGQRLIQDPTRVWIDNLGDSINSKYPEYGAVISPDERLMMFTSRRKGTTGGEKMPGMSTYYEDIYYSERKANGNWSEAKNFGPPINTEDNDAIVSLSPDGKQLLIYRPDRSGDGNIYISDKTREGWSEPEEMEDPVNSDYFENSGDFSFDGEKLYFVSTRPEGNRGKETPRPLLADNNPSEHSKDIWVVDWSEEDEEWTNLRNLGPTINTPYDEDGVYLHPDGKTIYFSSQGHNTMGGFDIFKAKRTSESSWSTPENIGYPVNTPDDDVFLVVGGSGRHAYYTSFKKDGYGEKDLYKVTFLGPEKEPVLMTEDKLLATKNKPVKEEVIEPKVKEESGSANLTILKGKVKDAKSKDPLEAKIKLLDNKTTNKISSTRSNEKNGKYMASLPAGKNYAIHVEKDGYLFHSENFNIPDSAAYQEVTKNIELKKIEIGKSIVLKNIFFDLDKASLRDASKTELERLIKMLEQHSNIKIEISGHTDSQGSDSYNEDLSQRRAQSVVDYLMEHGISKSRLEAEGYGEKKPIATNETEEGRQKNRRTEFKVIEK